jgi:hypothetical protein
MRSPGVRVSALCTILAMTVIAAGYAHHFASGEINWLESYPEALREAKRTGKPIFLEFRCEA